jgi:hypothetical protein
VHSAAPAARPATSKSWKGRAKCQWAAPCVASSSVLSRPPCSLRADALLLCRVLPAAGGGATFALAQGQPQQVLPLALGFAAFTALFDRVRLYASMRRASERCAAGYATAWFIQCVSHLMLQTLNSVLQRCAIAGAPDVNDMLFVQLGFSKSEESGKADVRAQKDAQFAASHQMLQHLGLGKYHNNVKNGLMTDDTIMLWTEQSLADCKIPPGPRCDRCW